MSFKSPFEIYQEQQQQKVTNEKVIKISEAREKLKWTEEIMMEKNREPRQKNVSPLLEWWLNEQIIK